MSDSLTTAAAVTAGVVAIGASGGAAAPAILGSAATSTTAATAGLIGTAGKLTLVQTLGFGLTAAGAFGAIESANVQASALESEAYQRDLQARASNINARKRAIATRDGLLRDLSQTNALVNARGGDISSGNARQALIESISNAQSTVDDQLFQGNIETAQNQLAASEARSGASATRTGGIATAVTRGATLIGDF